MYVRKKNFHVSYTWYKSLGLVYLRQGNLDVQGIHFPVQSFLDSGWSSNNVVSTDLVFFFEIYNFYNVGKSEFLSDVLVV